MAYLVGELCAYVDFRPTLGECES